MALKSFCWEASSSVDRKRDMLSELDDYLDSAHRFIEQAEQEIRDEPCQPTKPAPAPPTNLRNERFPPWSHSSLNSAARKKGVKGCWEREHTTNSLKALLDSLDIPSDHQPEASSESQDQAMNIKEIEKMTRDLVEGLNDIGETTPSAGHQGSPAKPPPRPPRPTNLTSTPVDARSAGKFASLVAFPSPIARFARTHLNRTLSSETGEEFATFLEALCDQGVASPNWQFVPRRSRSVESRPGDGEKEVSSLQPASRPWTSAENLAERSRKGLLSARKNRVFRGTPSPADLANFERPLDNESLLAALTRIGDRDKQDRSSDRQPAPPPSIASLILSDEDVFAEFEAEFTATLTKRSRKLAWESKLSPPETSPGTRLGPVAAPRAEVPPTAQKPSNEQLRAQFFAGMTNGGPEEVKPAPQIVVGTVLPTELRQGDGQGKEKVHLEALNHPLLISYRNARRKNAAVLQSNPDLSQIISNARAENRKSLIIPSSKESKDQLPHNCRWISSERRDDRNADKATCEKDAAAADDGNNNGDDNTTRTEVAFRRSFPLEAVGSDPYSEEFERSMESLESFSEKFQLDSISAGFEEELAKLFPLTDRIDPTNQEARGAGPERAAAPSETSDGSFLGYGGRRSAEKLAPSFKCGNRSTDVALRRRPTRLGEALPRLAPPKTPPKTPPNELRPESPDLAQFELNKSEQILAQLVKSSTDPAVAELLDRCGDFGTPNAFNYGPLCPCGKVLESDAETRSELCRDCSSSKAMRFLQACTKYSNKTNSLPILRGQQPNGEVRLREKPVRPSKQKRSCRIEFPLTDRSCEGSLSSFCSGDGEDSPNCPQSSILRSNSATDLHEAEAVQALEWLRETGFPQYAQQCEDNMFPLDISTVQRDHEKLGEDEMQSLIRRLTCLNKCARMRTETKAKLAYHSSDEDLALSENWQFHRPSRRWSRIATSGLPVVPTKQEDDGENKYEALKTEPHSSHDSVFVTPADRSLESGSHLPASLAADSGLSVSDERLREHLNRSPSPSEQQKKLRRSGSERIRDAIVRKVDSFRRRRREAQSKSPRSDRKNQSGLVQGSPKFLSPKGRRRECYDNRGLQGDPDAVNVESLAASVNASSIAKSGEVRRDSDSAASASRTSVCSSEGSAVPAATKWHCYPGTPVQTLPLPSNELVPLWRLTASDHMLLRKHALLRLTAIMERHWPPYKTGWTWSVPKFIKKMTSPSYKDKALFGIPLIVNVQRGGQPIPPCIQFAMQYIASKAPSCYGIFRKPGLKSRIDNLRAIHEQQVTNPSLKMYENQILFDIADMVKQYFREIPDGGLLTTKLAPTFRYIFMYIPEAFRLEAVQCLIMIMPDENREALEALLCFLAELSQYGAANGMTASNLATCFAPSIFQCTQSFSPKRIRRDSTSGDREVNKNIASNDCLLKMIEWHEKLFCALGQTLQSLRMVAEQPSAICHYLTDTGQPLHKLNFEVSLNSFLHEVRNSKGWTQIPHPHLELACKRIEDDFHFVRLWKISLQVAARPARVLNRILFERDLWDFSLVKQITVCKIDSETDVCGIIHSEMGKNARRQYLLLRAWRTNITAKGACALTEVSVSDPLVSGNIDPDPEHCQSPAPWVRAHVLASRYLVQPAGNGRSQVTHLARIEPMGRNGYWHSRAAGFILALQLHNLAQSFSAAVPYDPSPSCSGSSATSLSVNKD